MGFGECLVSIRRLLSSEAALARAVSRLPRTSTCYIVNVRVVMTARTFCLVLSFFPYYLLQHIRFACAFHTQHFGTALQNV